MEAMTSFHTKYCCPCSENTQSVCRRLYAAASVSSWSI